MSDQTLLEPELQDLQTRFRAKKLKFALSKSQINALLTEALSNNYKHYLMIRLQLECAMRVGEISHLRIESLNYLEKEVWIEAYQGDRNCGEWEPKSENSNRIISLTDDLIERLQPFLGKRRTGYVFLSNKGGNFDETSIIRFINKYAKDCPEIHRTIGSHALRRTCASHMIAQGISILKVSKMLGHKDLRTTFRYLYQIEDRNNDDIRNAVKEMY